MVKVQFSLKANQFLVIVKDVYPKILLIALINHSQKLYETLKRVNHLIKTYVENYSSQENCQSHLLKDLKLLQYHFSFLILIY